MAFRRRLILAVGGFDEAFRFGAEEEDLCRRAHMRSGGARLQYVHTAVVVHWFQEDVKDIVRRSRAYGRGNARRVLKHPDSRLIAYPFPVAVLASIGAAIATRHKRLTALGGLLPLLLYPRWVAQIRGSGSIAPLTYPYLQLAQEIAVMAGEIDGLRAGYEPVPTRHLRTVGANPAVAANGSVAAGRPLRQPQ
jgi:GT2 family glycosyltransferase